MRINATGYHTVEDLIIPKDILSPSIRRNGMPVTDEEAVLHEDSL
jgi:hypothetical protein